jgi:hypothetical protein
MRLISHIKPRINHVHLDFRRGCHLGRAGGVRAEFGAGREPRAAMPAPVIDWERRRRLAWLGVIVWCVLAGSFFGWVLWTALK